MPSFAQPSFQEFLDTRRFREIDGLRGIAIVFVIASHLQGPVWEHVEGIGVPLFLVNSGFLITMLLVREERRDGAVEVGGFFIRRALRLLPLYFLALILFTVLVQAGLAENPGDWWHRMILFLTFANEFGGHATFGHTWTLAVQEKFYIVWPLLAFAFAPTRRIRAWLAPGLAVVLIGVWFLYPQSHSTAYIPLLLGCSVALVMHRPAGFRVVSWLGHPAVFVGILAAVAGVQAVDNTVGSPSVLMSLMLALLVPGLVLGPQLLRRAVAGRALRYVGVRTYSIYLFHPLAISAIDLVLPGTDGVAVSLARLVFVFVSSLAFAAVTFRWVESPLNQWGHRLAARRAGRGRHRVVITRPASRAAPPRTALREHLARPSR